MSLESLESFEGSGAAGAFIKLILIKLEAGSGAAGGTE